MRGIGQIILTRALTCILLLAAMSGSASAAPFFGSSIQAKVVDSTNGQALEGVIVVASWDSDTPGPSLPTPHGHSDVTFCSERVNILTAVSGKDGVFKVPGWGPKGGCLGFDMDTPRLTLYKRGYQPLLLLNIDIYNDQDRPSPSFFHSTSRWDGKTIPLVPVGPHVGDGYTTGDPQADNLIAYIRMLPGGECFWGEERPAYLLAMQEERRLDPPLHMVEDELGISWDEKFQDAAARNGPAFQTRCAHPAGYIESLVKEADKVSAAIAAAQSQRQFQLNFPEGMRDEEFERSNPDPWALPASDVPKGDDLSPGGMGMTSVIYHVHLYYPEKPYFIRVYMVLPLDPNVISGFAVGVTPLGYGSPPACGAFTDPTPAGQTSPYLHASPPGLDSRGKVASGYPVCYLSRVLGSPDDAIAAMVRQNPELSRSTIYGRRPIYDSATRTYTLTEMSLFRNAEIKVPEYIELEDLAGASITTTGLTPTSNPRRWRIPPFVIHEPCTPEVKASSRSSLSVTAALACAPFSEPEPFTLVVTMPK